ncbi:PLP-dependent aminotransferase family protein [Acuticoccus sp. M5D2P5]|uniref:aminotransferase-like domain-containing protein n=1 Tax=Acuticoccus kalidii TaxID=2910977 RepID=UPI001F1DF0F4|nr:PLP-dependent aminotransferase family protein [Acuticoccus kalidii]
MRNTFTNTPSWRPRALSPDKPRYLALVEALRRDIDEGRLSEGHRLPPHRELARNLGLSVGTVSRAYQEAEQRGLIAGRVGQGTFVRRAAWRNEQGAAQSFVDLALNVPAPGEESDILAGLFAELSHPSAIAPLLDYGPHAGAGDHRAAVASFMAHANAAIDPSRVFLCNGAQHALSLALSLIDNPSRAILVDTQTYSGIKAYAAAFHAELVPVEMDAEGMILEALDAASRRSPARVLYVMPTLHSPTARTMSRARREAIADIAAARDLWIVEDDVYGFFDPNPPITLAELLPSHSFYISSFSKCVAPGFRLGALAVPPTFVERANLMLHATSWFVSPVLCMAATRLIETGKLDALVAQRRRQASERYGVFRETFSDAALIDTPAFFGWLPLPADWSATSFATAARAAGILVTPPAASNVGPSEPDGVRLCLGIPPDLETLAAVLRTLHDLISRRPWNILSVA